SASRSRRRIISCSWRVCRGRHRGAPFGTAKSLRRRVLDSLDKPNKLINSYLLMGRSPRVTREQVLDAARETFVEHGFAGTTLAQTGRRLSVSPAALLRHAPTKEALFLAAMGRPDADDLLPLEFLEQCDGTEDPRRVLRRVGEVFIPFLEKRIRGL